MEIIMQGERKIKYVRPDARKGISNRLYSAVTYSIWLELVEIGWTRLELTVIG